MKNLFYSVSIICVLLLAGCADAGKDQSVNAGDTVTLDASASTASVRGELKKYKWMQTEGPRVATLFNTSSVQANFIAPSVTENTQLVFKLKTVEEGGIPNPFTTYDTVNIMVKVKSVEADTIPPVISLNGENNITLQQGTSYKELGATVVDNVDGNVSIIIIGEVNTSKVGNYTITYSAKDSAGNEASLTRTVHVKEQAVMLNSITVDKTNVDLAEGNSTLLKVLGEYSDKSTKDVTSKVTWDIANSAIVSMDTYGTLKALKEGNTTIQARYEGKISESVMVTVYKEINAYRLPPEPDPVVNNATLLGVDSNDNGVRDDVERKIIVKYQKPIEIEVMMSFAKVDQETLEKPLSEALNLERKASRIGDCKMFLRYKGIKIKRAIKYSEDLTYNTKERAKKYMEYNKKLSGGVYGSSPADWNADACDFDVEQMLKDRK